MTKEFSKQLIEVADLNERRDSVKAQKVLNRFIKKIKKSSAAEWLEVNLLQAFCHLLNKKLNEAEYLLIDCRDFAEKHDHEVAILRADHMLGKLYFSKGEFNRAMIHVKEAVFWASSFPEEEQEYSHILNTLGAIYQKVGNFKEAFFCFEKGMLIQKRINDVAELAITYGNIGRLYYDERNYQGALSAFQKDLEISEQTKNVKGQLVMHYLIGTVSMKMNRVADAHKSYQKFYNMSKTTRHPIDQGLSAACLGNIALAEGRIKDAEKLFGEGNRHLKKLGQGYFNGIYHYLFSGLWSAKEKPKKAVEHLDKSIEIFRKYRIRNLLIDALLKKASVVMDWDIRAAILVSIEAYYELAEIPVRRTDEKYLDGIFRRVLHHTSMLFEGSNIIAYFKEQREGDIYVLKRDKNDISTVTKLRLSSDLSKKLSRLGRDVFEVNDTELINDLCEYLSDFDLSSNDRFLHAPYFRSEEELGGLFVMRDSIERRFSKFTVRLMHAHVEVIAALDVLRKKDMLYYDDLTGLYLRQNFESYLNIEYHRSMRNKSGFSVVMIDIDHFKKFNDTYGHQVGDVVLKKVASTILSIIRTSDIAGRYGGEEMILLLPEMTAKDIFGLAEKVRRGVEAISLDDYSVPETITISLGTTTYHHRKNNVPPEKLIKQADDMLYKAKENGRNRVEKFI